MKALQPGFNSRVYALVEQVPAGRVTTYGDVAGLLGSRRVARHVGFALAALPDPTVPWHRVINAQGRISFRGDPARSGEQRARLEAEGVVFDAHERVDLRRYRWDFPGVTLSAGAEAPEDDGAG
ncbi:MAG: MGMT family protein [Myxococcales bacterium]|nr:MGMT family protein [Myxococcales bacterium]